MNFKFDFYTYSVSGSTFFKTKGDPKHPALLWFNTEPSEKILKFFDRLSEIFRFRNFDSRSVISYDVVEPNNEDIKDILAFEDWGVKEIGQKSDYSEQINGMFYSFKNQFITIYLKETKQTEEQLGIVHDQTGYHLAK